MQRGAERRRRADHVEVAGALLDVADEVALGVVVAVALVDDRDDGARPDDAGLGGGDDLGVLEDRLELADAALHVALLVLGGVVVAVLGEVAELAGPLDLRGDLDAAPRGEVVELGLQPVERLLGQLVRFHGASTLPAGCAPTGGGSSSERRRRCRCASLTGHMAAQGTPHRVAVIGGDGIGPEVTAEAAEGRAGGRRRPSTPSTFDLGGQRYLRDGEILSDATLDELRGFDAILLGAVGTPDVPPGVIERGLLLKMRFELDLYVNQRPFTAPGHDFVVIRENTEGPYVGEGGVLRQGTPHEVATQGSVNTRMGVERCVRYAFELACQRPAGTSRSCTRPTC